MVPHPFRLLRRPRVAVLTTLSAALAIVAGASCDKMPLVAPSGTAITLIAATNVLPVNGSVEITAVLIEGGQQAGTGTEPGATTPGTGTPVHNGTLVSFTTTLGKIEPAEARTTNGKATVRLIADGRSGTATVTAFSGGANNTLEVLVGAAGAARILVTASPQALPSTGGQAQILARVEDARGNGLMGVPVSFSTTAGTLSAGGALTNDNGVAATTLTSTAAATVTARAGGGEGTLEGTVAITVNAALQVTLTAPTDARVSTPTALTIAIGGTAVAASASLDFGDGDVVQLGSINGSQPVPHIYGRSGILIARATVVGVDGTTTVRTTPVVVGNLDVTIAASAAQVDINIAVTFTVTVTPTAAIIEAYQWDFGDGVQVSNRSRQMSHAYTTPGQRTVTVTVVPLRGEPITLSIPISVK